jgi:hypothetical protein
MSSSVLTGGKRESRVIVVPPDNLNRCLFQALSTPLASCCRHGRVPEPSWECATHAMGLPVVPASRLCTWYVILVCSSLMSHALAGKTQAQSASSQSTTRTGHGTRRSRQAFPAGRTATSSTAYHSTTARVPGPRTFRLHFPCYYLLFNFAAVLLLALMAAWRSPSACTRRLRCTRVR